MASTSTSTRVSDGIVGFSWQWARLLAQCSKAVYGSEAIVERYANEVVGTNRWAFFAVDEVECAVFQVGRYAILSFRGTDSIADWIKNLRALPVDWHTGNIHRGFRATYEVFRDSILPDVNEFLSQDDVHPALFVTGHSLGGAIATLFSQLASGNHAMNGGDAPDLNIKGIYAFGQPRIGDEQFSMDVNERLGDRLFRFVNNEDIVTRIPPWNEHVGKLIRFGSAGELTTFEADELLSPQLEDDADHPETPIETRELEEIQHRIATVELAASEVLGTESIGDYEIALEGIIPGVDDHSMDLYLANVRRFAGGVDFVSSLIQDYELDESNFNSRQLFRSFYTLTDDMSDAYESTEEDSDSGHPPAIGDETGNGSPSSKSIPVIIRINNSQWVAPSGLEIFSQVGLFVSGRATASQLRALQADPGVLGIEESRNALCLELDSSVPFVRGKDLHRPPVEECGSEALIVIIDTGIDIHHRAFLDSVGQSRIVGVWHQAADEGRSPNEIDSSVFSQKYGALYTAEDIAHYLASEGTTPLALRDPLGHGTAVASVAAGSPVDNGHSGMAPEAKILCIIPHADFEPGQPPSLGYSVSHFDALALALAVSSGNSRLLSKPMPAVVNVSMGMSAGAHDGSTSLEATFDSITNSGRNRGFVVVKSAGNERRYRGHARVVAANGALDMKWTSGSSCVDDYFECWYDGNDSMSFVLTDPLGNSTGEIDDTNRTGEWDLGGNTVRMRLTPFHPDNGDNRLVIWVDAATNPIQQGEWKLRVVGHRIASENRFVDIWVERRRGTDVSFVDFEPTVTLTVPGTARTVITVGATDMNIPLSLLDATSWGRTRDGRTKPDLVAPGQGLRLARAFQPSNKEYSVRSGTSFAAPHVSGAIALAMSGLVKKDLPPLNAVQAARILQATVQQRQHLHHDGYGFGLLDAKAFYETAVNQVPIS